jgi:hypothetical protein
MHLRVVLDDLRMATLFPAVRAGLNFALQRGKIALNNLIGYGWIRKGRRFEIRNRDGRKRINLMGAYNPKDGEVIVQDYETLNQELDLPPIARHR